MFKSKSHKDLNIYYHNSIKASEVKFSADYSYTLCKLMNIEHMVDLGQLKISECAQEFLKVLNDTTSLVDIDRFCLVLAEPLSSKMHVLSAAQNQSLGPNLMGTGYSCYVSQNSSLFDIKASSIRVFGNIEKVMQNFGDRPPQRSISRLYKMGVKSGISFPLGKFGNFRSYVFMNSCQEAQFSKLKSEDNCVLSLTKLIASNLIYRYLKDIITVDQIVLDEIKQLEHQNIFNQEKFRQDIQRLFHTFFEDMKVSVHFKIERDNDILFNYNSFLYALIKLFQASGQGYGNSVQTIEFVLDEKRMVLVCKIKGLSLGMKMLAQFEEYGVSFFKNIACENGDTVIEIKTEKAQQGFEYSAEST